MTLGAGTCSAPFKWGVYLTNAGFLILISIPATMAFVAGIMRHVMNRTPYMAPTDLVGAIALADLAIAIDPDLTSKWISADISHSVVSGVHVYGVLLAIIIWVVSILKIEPLLEQAGHHSLANTGTGAHIGYGAFFKWLAVFVSVLVLLGMHFFIYSFCWWPTP